MADVFVLGRQALAHRPMLELYLLLLCAIDHTTSLNALDIKEGNQLVLDVLSKARITCAPDVIVVAIASILERKEVKPCVKQQIGTCLKEIEKFQSWNGVSLSPRATVEVSALLVRYFK
jgi:hypothetical protein